MIKPKFDHALIKEQLKQGMTYQKIATIVGGSKQRIHYLAKKWNLQKKIIKQPSTNDDLTWVKRDKFRIKKAIAVSKGQEWTVKFHEIDFPTHCPILGLEIDYFAEKAQDNSPSFDRIDNSKGYIPDNVQIISWRANRIKSNSTIEELRKIADYLDAITNS